MASRILHYALATNVQQACNIRDFDRFLLGELLPDAHRENLGTAQSHLKITLDGSRKKTYDLRRFRETFARELQADDLYRGYYLHLVQDIHFRDFVYRRHRWNPHIPGNVARLHRDYRMLNPWAIREFHLENHLVLPEAFAREPLNRLYPFDLQTLAQDFRNDFLPEAEEDFFFFTPDKASDYVTLATKASILELQALEEGRWITDMEEMAWDNTL